MYCVTDCSEEFRTCLVCSDKITAMHLGMDICRACSSFFKRTKTLDRQYPCRQGTMNCLVAKDSKFSCRRCRFYKCLAVGMQYDGLMRVRTKRVAPLLERIEVEYGSFVERRKTKEIKIIEPLSSDMFARIAHPKEVLYLNLLRSYKPTDPVNNELFIMTVEETYRFFKRIFPSTSEKDVELSFKEFLGVFSLIDYQQRSVRIFGKDGEYIMCSAITCIEADDFLPREDGDNFDDMMLKSSARSYLEEHMAIFLPIFRKSDISDKEFCALIALLMSETDDSSQCSAETLEKLDNMREEVFRELQNYYRNELRIFDFSVRLGNLMSLHHAMMECKSLFQVYFRFHMTIFEDLTIDKKMQDLFL